MSDLEKISGLIATHLQKIPENDGLDTWKIMKSPVEGRGLFSKRDLFPGDLIYVDHPLIAGPRISEDVPIGCIACNTLIKPLKMCTMGCGLLLCSDCPNVSKHKPECALITSWGKKEDSIEIDGKKFARNIVPLRSLILNGPQKELLLDLAVHDSPRHGREVEFIKKHFQISKEDEDTMMHACRVLDANAYEMLMRTEEKDCVDLRGLFPMSALLNHTCSPNTRISFDVNGNMTLVATAFIPEGSEIFTSYTGLIWGTPARRHHLKETKHFLCDCFRCCDKTELGTNLAALHCLNRQCTGILLPIDPLSFDTLWKCQKCEIRVTPDHVGILQTAIARLLGSMQVDSPDGIDNFITSHLLKFLPESNYIVLDLKLRIIWGIGDAEDHKWREVSASRLTRVEELCREVLATCKALQLGAATLAARLHLRLHGCLLEKLRRLMIDSPAQINEILDLEKEVVSHINKSNAIFKGDVLAPKDLETRTKLANTSVQSLIEYDNDLK